MGSDHAIFTCLRVFGALLLAAITVESFAQQGVPEPPAVPIEPVAAIVEAFRSHSVVAVMAGHGEARGYAFGLSLVRDPRFAAVVNDIVGPPARDYSLAFATARTESFRHGVAESAEDYKGLSHASR